MNIREKFEKETGVPAYISTGVGSTRPTHHYAEWLENQLAIDIVEGPSKQLKPLPPNECEQCGVLIDHRLNKCGNCRL